MRRLLFLAALLVLPGALRAQPVSGLYLGAGLGANFHSQSAVKIEGNPAPFQTDTSRPHFGAGARGNLALGWGFGNGLRAELELALLGNSVDGNRPAYAGGGRRDGGVATAAGLANILYDFEPWHIAGLHVIPELGVGLGIASIYTRHLPDLGVNGSDAAFTHTRTAIAGQFIAGVSVPLTAHLSATLETRALITGGSRDNQHVAAGGARRTLRVEYPAAVDTSVLLGLRYAFGG